MARAVLLLVTLCAVASANDKSDALVRDAEALAQTGDFVGAAAKFREAYLAEPRAETMCNVGIAYHKAKDLPRAQLFLSHCLKRATAMDAQLVAAMRGVLANAEGLLKQGDFTPVDIVVDPEATEVGIPTFVADASFVGSHLVWLPFGKHDLVFRTEGYIEQTLTITTENRDTMPIHVKLVKQPTKQTVVKREPRSKIPAIAASAVTVVCIIWAGVSYFDAHDRADIAAKAIDMTIYDDDKDYIDGKNQQMAIAGGLSILGAAASGYLWYRALEPTTKVEVMTTPTSAAVSFRFRF